MSVKDRDVKVGDHNRCFVREYKDKVDKSRSK